jgi:hypothetical protein
MLAEPFPHIIFSESREMWDKDHLGGRMLLAENHHAMQTVQFPIHGGGGRFLF